MKKDKAKLQKWKDRLKDANAAYDDELSKMEHREAIYDGSRELRKMTDRDKTSKATHVRNIVAEIIESEVNSNIPQPKVTARRKEDEPLAKIIEDMLRNELDRLPMEAINDLAERTSCIQGGVGYLLEWDNTKRTHTTVGELTLACMHPTQIIPQDGVYSGIEDMDYIILKVPTTKEFIRKRYGVTVEDEGEEEPTVKAFGASPAADMVTMYVGYARNESGGIGKFTWVRDSVLEDMEDYQARKLRKCAVCGATEPNEEILDSDGKREKDICPYCGSSKWEVNDEDYETIMSPIQLSDGGVIDPIANITEVETGEFDEMGNPIMAQEIEYLKLPYYKPNIYPILLQRNVSKHGKFLGGSDVDSIEDQYNTTNRISTKIMDKLLKSGSYMVLPQTAMIKEDSDELKSIRLQNAADKAMIGVYDMEGNVQQDLEVLEHVYQESRQIIGITDSFQGRTDPTATSGKAKEFAAAQSAGRLESKRTMKNFAYSQLFEAMFKFKLAYTDEPVPIVSKDANGQNQYSEFNRYDFLKMDDAGEYYWNDQFLFSVDPGATLANNREAMWQETRANFQMGCFGDPTNIDTLILYWTKMSLLHYPGSDDTLTNLKAQKEQQVMQQQMMMQQEMAMRQAQLAMSQRAQQEALMAARQDAAYAAAKANNNAPQVS